MTENSILKKFKPGKAIIAILLFLLISILLISTARDMGMGEDEPAYINGAASYGQWLRILAKEGAAAIRPELIDTYWSENHEHPPLEKVVSAAAWFVGRHYFDPLNAARFGPILLAAVLGALLFLLIADIAGYPAGIFAVFALFSMPRFFYHAHLAALDAPMAVTSFLTTFVFWKTIDRKGWAWGIPLGAAWGLALATKLNGAFIPIALVGWILIFRRSWASLIRLVVMGVTALAVFIITWPWMYYQTWSRMVEYLNFHAGHKVPGQWYLGQYYSIPPWHFVFVILWAVIPLTLIILAVFGSMRPGTEAHGKRLSWLLLISVIASISPFLFGKVVAYNLDRLVMPVFPYIAALAGIGFGGLVKVISRYLERWKRPALAIPPIILLGALLLTPQIVNASGVYPNLLSYYSEGVGGLPGATKLGLETTYWCESYMPAIRYIDQHANPGDIIWSHCSVKNYKSLGLLRNDVVSKTKFIPNANWYIYQYHQSEYKSKGEAGYLPNILLKDQKPVLEIIRQGVPIMKLYRVVE